MDSRGKYEAQNAEELSFPKGAVLELVQTNEKTGWHRMKLDGVVGNVNSAYVQSYKKPGPAVPKVPPRRASVFDRIRAADAEAQGPTQGKALKVDKTAVEAAVSKAFIQEDEQGPAHISLDLLQCGVFYHVQYLGFVAVEKPLRDFSNEDRHLVLLEAINICAARTGLSPAVKMPVERHVPPNVREALGVVYVVRKKGCSGRSSDSELLISLECVRLAEFKSKEVIEEYPLLDIAVLSGGSAWFPKCVAFVSRSLDGTRICHVIECGKYSNTVLVALSEAIKSKHGKNKAAV